MKLVILCGSLEERKDGVGDYSRNLADLSRRLGHSTWLVALNDPWIEIVQESSDTLESRLPKTMSWKERMLHLQRLLKKLTPDVVSLQFVPFAYHDKGICRKLVKSLGSIPKIKTWHIMFHELWLGLEPAHPLKYKILGWLQKRNILQLIKTLSPKIIHTQAAAYVDILSRENIPVKQLPLFSNIDVNRGVDLVDIKDYLPKDHASKLVAVFFGSLHPEWNADELMAKIGSQKVIFLAVGRLGLCGLKVWEQFSRKYDQQAEFVHLGELSSSEISKILQMASFGVAASPWNLIDKSGSVAAMIEHGLPVIVTRNDFLSGKNFPPNPLWESQLHPLWESAFNIKNLIKSSATNNLEIIGRQFLDDLSGVLR